MLYSTLHYLHASYLTDDRVRSRTTTTTTTITTAPRVDALLGEGNVLITSNTNLIMCTTALWEVVSLKFILKKSLLKHS